MARRGLRVCEQGWAGPRAQPVGLPCVAEDHIRSPSWQLSVAGEGGPRASSWFRGGLPAPFVRTASRQPRARGQLRAAPLVLTASGREVAVHVCSGEDRSQGPAEVDVVRSLPSTGRRRLRGCVGDSVTGGGRRRLPGELRWGGCPRLSGAWTAWVCVCTACAHAYMHICAQTGTHIHVCTCSRACLFIHVCACVGTCACVCTRVSVHVYAGVCTCVFMPVCACVYMCTCTPTCICACACVCVCTNACACVSVCMNMSSMVGNL